MSARTRVLLPARRVVGLLAMSGLTVLWAASLAAASARVGVVTAPGTETCGSQQFPVTEMLMGMNFTISSPGGTSSGTKSGDKITASGTGGQYAIAVLSPTRQTVSEVFGGQTCTGIITLTKPLVPAASSPTPPVAKSPPAEPTPAATSSESSDLKPLFGGLAVLGAATILASCALHDDDKKKVEEFFGFSGRDRDLDEPQRPPGGGDAPLIGDVVPVEGDGSGKPPDEVM